MAKKKVSKQPKQKKAYVLIRATGADAQLIQDLKKHFNTKTNTDAVLRACKGYLEQQKELWDRKQREINLTVQTRELQELVHNAFNGLHMLLKWGNDKLPKGHSRLPEGSDNDN